MGNLIFASLRNKAQVKANRHLEYNRSEGCNCKKRNFDFSMITVSEVKRLHHKFTNITINGLITHATVTLTYFCYKCNKKGFLIMEYGTNGKEWKLGRYAKQKK